MLDRSRSRDRSKAGGAFSPAGLFVTGAQGAWYDPSDYSTLFQNSAGTTPVTAVEQPVRLMLDRSRGLVLGGELVTNGGFATDAGWTLSAGWAVSGGQATFTANGTSAAITRVANAAAVSGRMYEITFDVVSNTLNAGAFRVGAFSGSSYFNALVQLAANTTPAGTYTLRVVSTPSGTGTVLDFWVSNAATSGAITIDNISVRELPGNHAVAPNDASRPVLRARYNLLTFSEQFDNAGWTKNAAGTGIAPVVTANAAVAPDGTTTADSIVFDRGAGNAIGDQSRVVQAPSTVAGSYTQTVWLKAATAGDVGKQLALRNVAGSGYLAVTLTADWVRHTRVETRLSDNWEIANRGTVTADNTVTALVWGAQLLTAADAAATGNAYQRIAAATDYDVSNPVFRPYLAFDGTDDSFGTSAIDFSGTDEMTLFAGVTKLSDAALGVVAELTVSSSTQDGAFTMLAPDSPTGYAWASRGTTRVFPGVGGFNAPNTAVLTGIGDIGGDVATLRVNGAQAATNTNDQGTGNYANAALFIGRRGGSSLSYNGRLTSLIVLGRTATAAEISATESWIAGKTGVTL